MVYRIRVQIDPEGRFEECNGEPHPLSATEYAQNQYFKNAGKDAIPYREYLHYYGNPRRHVFLEVCVERQCAKCRQWVALTSLHGIDFMDDSLEVRSLDLNKDCSVEIFPIDKPLPGYLNDVARDLVVEAQTQDVINRLRGNSHVCGACEDPYTPWSVTHIQRIKRANSKRRRDMYGIRHTDV